MGRGEEIKKYGVRRRKGKREERREERR